MALFDIIVYLLCVLPMVTCVSRKLEPHCNKDQEKCVFNFEITRIQTMIRYNTPDGNGRNYSSPILLTQSADGEEAKFDRRTTDCKTTGIINLRFWVKCVPATRCILSDFNMDRCLIKHVDIAFSDYQCPDGYSKCLNNKECFMTRFKCDGDFDCTDQSDEGPDMCSK